jgi:hypothetical protein
MKQVPSEDLQVLDATVQNLVTTVTWCPGFVHSHFNEIKNVELSHIITLDAVHQGTSCVSEVVCTAVFNLVSLFVKI